MSRRGSRKQTLGSTKQTLGSIGKTRRQNQARQNQARPSQRAIEALKIQLEKAVDANDAKEISRLQRAINAVKGAQTSKNRMIEQKQKMMRAREAAAQNNELGVLSPEKQQRAIDLIPHLKDHPEAFEEFSTLPLETQIKGLFQFVPSSGGGQKGGGLSEAIQGAVDFYMTPAWKEAIDRSNAAKNYVSDIALNYMDKIKTLASGAGLSGPNAQQNLQSILYGLAVLAAAWNMGLIQMVPGLTLYLIDILSSIATTAAALAVNPMIQEALLKIAAAAAVYRYQDIPIGAYGVVASTTAPIFTAIYARGDQAFQAAFPQFGENIAAGGAAQLQELKKLLKDTVEMSKAKLQEAVAAVKPGIAAIKGVGTAWSKYLNESIQTLINGLAQVKTDADKIRVYYKFLEDAGKQAQEMGEPIVIQDEVAAAEIAGLIPPPILEGGYNINNLVVGAVAIGDIINDENPIVDDDEAAALLLALGNIAPANMVPNNNPAAGPAADAGGRALRRRRHRKTAKKSHKKRHTKKHKRKSTKGKNGKRGKKSKRHTKRRSYKVGAHSPYH